MAEQDTDQQTLNEVMQLLEAAPDCSKPSELLISLPANNISEQREKIAVLVSAGKSKEPIGVQLTHEQVKRLSDKDVEKYCKQFESYVGSKTSKTLTQSSLTLASKAVGMAVKLDNVEALQKDLQEVS